MTSLNILALLVGLLIAVSFLLINFKKRFVASSFILFYTLFNVVGAYYYYFGGDVYLPPSHEALLYSFVLHSSVFLSYLVYLFISALLKARRSHSCVNFNDKEFSADGISGVNIFFLFLIILVPFLYILAFRDGFIFYKLLLGIDFSERNRPDVTGDIPFYYSFTVWVASLATPVLVSLMRFSKGTLSKFLFFFLTAVLCLAIGSKSSLMMIAVFLFIVFDSSMAKKVFLSAAVGSCLIAFYIGMKVVYAPHLLENSNILTLMAGSLFNRLMVINSSVLGFVIDYFYIDKLTIPEGFNHLKQFVFYKIYGYLPGGAPVSMSVEALAKYGSVSYAYVYNVFLFIFLFSYFSFFLYRTKSFFHNIIQYLAFYGCVLAIAGYFSDVLIRSLLPIAVFYFMSRLTFFNRPK